MLYDALFGALAADGRESADGELLKHKIGEDAFGRRQSAYDARALIKRAITVFMGEEAQLHFTGREWQFITVDKEKEKRLFSVPYEVFGHSLYDRIGRHGLDMSVSEESLLGRLHHLHELAERAGLELSFDGRPVERVS